MTPLQLQKLLDRAGLSQRGAARELGINERTMRKYISGDSSVPRTVEFALQWVAHLRGNVQKQGPTGPRAKAGKRS